MIDGISKREWSLEVIAQARYVHHLRHEWHYGKGGDNTKIKQEIFNLLNVNLEKLEEMSGIKAPRVSRVCKFLGGKKVFWKSQLEMKHENQMIKSYLDVFIPDEVLVRM